MTAEDGFRIPRGLPRPGPSVEGRGALVREAAAGEAAWMRPGARCASLHGYADLCRSMGVAPGPLLAGGGLDEACLDEPERWGPAAAGAELLGRAAAEAGRGGFGVPLAPLRPWSAVGTP